jgi:sialidase-1
MNNRIVAIIALLWCAACAAADVQKMDLFTAGEGGYASYRIPGIVATKKGTLLAYCEARKNSAADWGHIDVRMRRSSDGGKTWDAPRKILQPPADAKRNPVAPQRKEGGITVNNPVAIADEHSGAVHFLYCVEYARCFYVRSDDEGRTFGEPVEITATIERFRAEYEWKVLATGPGHGIQLRTGRLIVPVWLSTSDGGHAHRPSRVATIYSDDGGATWERGDIVPTAELVNPSETAAVELEDGRVMLNMRHESQPRLRAVVTGPDGAGGWGEVRFDEALPEPVCMAGLVRAGDGGILFSNPHNPHGRERKNLTVKLSADGGKTWPHARTLEPGPGGYSDLATTGGDVLCLYERTGTLTLARFPISWVMEKPAVAR